MMQSIAEASTRVEQLAEEVADVPTAAWQTYHSMTSGL